MSLSVLGSPSLFKPWRPRGHRFHHPRPLLRRGPCGRGEAGGWRACGGCSRLALQQERRGTRLPGAEREVKDELRFSSGLRPPPPRALPASTHRGTANPNTTDYPIPALVFPRWLASPCVCPHTPTRPSPSIHAQRKDTGCGTNNNNNNNNNNNYHPELYCKPASELCFTYIILFNFPNSPVRGILPILHRRKRRHREDR